MSRRVTDEEHEEYKRFVNRLRFDQSKFWDFRPAIRSYPPSTWPAFEEQMRLYGPCGMENLRALRLRHSSPKL